MLGSVTVAVARRRRQTASQSPDRSAIWWRTGHRPCPPANWCSHRRWERSPSFDWREWLPGQAPWLPVGSLLVISTVDAPVVWDCSSLVLRDSVAVVPPVSGNVLAPEGQGPAPVCWTPIPSRRRTVRHNWSCLGPAAVIVEVCVPSTTAVLDGIHIENGREGAVRNSHLNRGGRRAVGAGRQQDGRRSCS